MVHLQYHGKKELKKKDKTPDVEEHGRGGGRATGEEMREE